MSSYSYFGVNRGRVLPSLHQPDAVVTSVLEKLHQWPSVYPKLPSLTRRGYNVTRLQEHAGKYLVGHAAGLTSVEHAFQPIDSKKFATAWAEIRAGHAIPRLRAGLPETATGSTQSLSSHSRLAAASNLSGGRHPSGSTDAGLLPPDVGAPASDGSQRAAGRRTRLSPLSGQTAAAETAQSRSLGTSLSKATNTTFQSGPAASATTADRGSAPSAADVAAAAAAAAAAEPRQRVVPRREAQRYMQAKLAYLIEYDVDKKRRKAKFVKQLRSVIERVAEIHNQTMENLEARRRDGRLRQERQLMQLRERFDGERRQRLRRQHVSKNALSYEQNRSLYGLPEPFAAKTVHSAKLHRKNRGVSAARIDEERTERMHSRLSERYSKRLFSIPLAPTFNPRAVTPKMEGYDTVEVTTLSKTGRVKKKQVLADDILRDAMSALKATDAAVTADRGDTNPSTRVPAAGGTISRLSTTPPNDEGNEEDIFERLFRKYNIIVEDD